MKLSEAIADQCDQAMSRSARSHRAVISQAHANAGALLMALSEIIERLEKGEITDIYNPSDIDNLS